MKKITLKLSDFTFEKLKLESIEQRKSISKVIEDRIFHKEFSEIVENAFDDMLEKQYLKMLCETNFEGE